MTDLISAGLVRLDADLGSEKHDVIRALAQVVADAGRATDRDQLVADLFERESKTGTGLPGGIAIPHCRTAGVAEPTLAFARLAPKVDFGAKDGAADLVFLIAAPAGGDNTHLQLLTKLARSLVKPSFTDALRAAVSP
jgi:fructose PTS system EIIBC or EIIC component